MGMVCDEHRSDGSLSPWSVTSEFTHPHRQHFEKGIEFIKTMPSRYNGRGFLWYAIEYDDHISLCHFTFNANENAFVVGSFLCNPGSSAVIESAVGVEGLEDRMDDRYDEINKVLNMKFLRMMEDRVPIFDGRT